MAGDSIQLVVVTPVNQLLSEAVTEAQLPGADGYLGVLPGHAPLITELGIGELTYKTANGQTGLLAIIRDFVEVFIDDNAEAEGLVLRVNNGRRRVPTIQVGDRFFACSPFNAQQLATELNVPLNR